MTPFFVPGVAEIVIILLFGGGGFGLPLGMPPGPEDPLLAKVAPEECLFYTSWAGIAKSDPNSPNQTEQLLAEPEVQHLLAEAERLVTTGIRRAVSEEGGPQMAAIADDAIRWGKRLLFRPGAVFVSDVELTGGLPKAQAAAVLNVGDDAQELRRTLEKYQQTFLREAAQPVDFDGDTWYRITLHPGVPPITWGVKGKYFAVGAGENVIEGILKRASTGPPQWLASIEEQLPVPRRATVSYVNVEAIRKMLLPMVPQPMARAVVQALGLDQVTSLVAVTGLDEDGFVNKTLVGLEGEPRGLFRLCAGDPLAREDLAPIPRDATVALAARVDLEEVLETVLSIAGDVDPNARGAISRGIGRLEEELDFNLRRDLLGSLGDTWCIYNSPGEGGLVITGLTAVVEVKDREKLAAIHGRVLAGLRAAIDRRGRRRGPKFDQFEFAGEDVFVFNARDDDFPLAPSWCLTEDALVVAPFPQNVKAYLSRGDDHESLAAVPEVARLFESGRGPMMVSYLDTKSIFDLLYPFAPVIAQVAASELARGEIDVSVSILPSAAAIGEHLRPCVGAVRRTEAGIEMVSFQSLPGGNAVSTAPVAAALLLPAVGSARGAARRAQSTNNLKQIGLALHNHHDAYRSFPAAYTTDDEDKPLLSWRVRILPFVEQAPLYEQFRLDEPWDSEHNKRLIPFMPPVYRAPGSTAEPGKTNYLGVAGEQGIFRGKEPVGMADVRDGTSNTIAVVEASDELAVIWTKPGDYEPDPQDPIKGLVGLRRGVFQALMTDGSVRAIAETIDPQVIQALFTRAGGEAIGTSSRIPSRSRRRRAVGVEIDTLESLRTEREAVERLRAKVVD